MEKEKKERIFLLLAIVDDVLFGTENYFYSFHNEISRFALTAYDYSRHFALVHCFMIKLRTKSKDLPRNNAEISRATSPVVLNEIHFSIDCCVGGLGELSWMGTS